MVKHEYEVCGVIADYHSGDALSENEKTEHNAIGVITPQQGGMVLFLVKTRGDNAQAHQAIRNTCKQVAKELMGVPAEMEVEYMDDTLKNNLKVKHNMMVLIITFTDEHLYPDFCPGALRNVGLLLQRSRSGR